MLQFHRPRTIWGIMVALGDMFNDLVVKRYSSDGLTVLETKSVPITFGPHQKHHLDRQENYTSEDKDTTSKNRYYLKLPRIALVLKSMSYGTSRTKSPNDTRMLMPTSGASLDYVDIYQVNVEPVPYDLNFLLDIRSDKLEYTTQILENILPYFNKTLHLRVKEFPFLDDERDLQVSLDNVEVDFVEQMDETADRFVNARLELTVQAYFYRPTQEAKFIKTINVTYSLGSSGDSTLVSEYSTSGFESLSAAPDSSIWISSGGTSGTTEDGYYFTSAVSY